MSSKTETSTELDRLRDIEVTYEQIKRIAQMQSYDEYNHLEDAWEFANDLWKSGIFDILHPSIPSQITEENKNGPD